MARIGRCTNRIGLAPGATTSPTSTAVVASEGSEHDATAFYESDVTVHLETLLTDIPFRCHVDDSENGLHLLKPTIAGDKAYNTLRVPAPWQVICIMTGEPKVSQKKQTARQKRKMVREDSDEGDNERTPDRTEKHGKIIFNTGIANWRTQVERTLSVGLNRSNCWAKALLVWRACHT